MTMKRKLYPILIGLVLLGNQLGDASLAQNQYRLRHRRIKGDRETRNDSRIGKDARIMGKRAPEPYGSKKAAEPSKSMVNKLRKSAHENWSEQTSTRDAGVYKYPTPKRMSKFSRNSKEGAAPTRTPAPVPVPASTAEPGSLPIEAAEQENVSEDATTIPVWKSSNQKGGSKASSTGNNNNNSEHDSFDETIVQAPSASPGGKGPAMNKGRSTDAPTFVPTDEPLYFPGELIKEPTWEPTWESTTEASPPPKEGDGGGTTFEIIAEDDPVGLVHCQTAYELGIGRSAVMVEPTSDISHVPDCYGGYTSEDSNTHARGSWFKVTGNGAQLSATSCPARVSIFEGTCGNLECSHAKNTFHGCQAEWTSIPGKTYYALVQSSSLSTMDMGITLTIVATEETSFDGTDDLFLDVDIENKPTTDSDEEATPPSKEEDGTTFVIIGEDDPVGLVDCQAAHELGIDRSAFLVEPSSDISHVPDCKGGYTSEDFETHARGSWFKVTGNGARLRAKSCPALLSIFEGSCGDLKCAHAKYNDYGCQAEWKTRRDKTYYVLVQSSTHLGSGSDDDEGFTLGIALTIEEAEAASFDGTDDIFLGLAIPEESTSLDEDAVTEECKDSARPVPIDSQISSDFQFLYSSDDVTPCGNAISPPKKTLVQGAWFTVFGHGKVLRVSSCPFTLSVFGGSCEDLSCVDGEHSDSLVCEFEWRTPDSGDVNYILVQSIVAGIVYRGPFDLSVMEVTESPALTLAPTTKYPTPTQPPFDGPETMMPTFSPTKSRTPVTASPTFMTTQPPITISPTFSPTTASSPTATPVTASPTVATSSQTGFPTIEPTSSPVDVPGTAEPTLEGTAAPTDDDGDDFLVQACLNTSIPIEPGEEVDSDFLFPLSEDFVQCELTVRPAKRKAIRAAWFTAVGDGNVLRADSCPYQLSVYTGGCENLTCTEGVYGDARRCNYEWLSPQDGALSYILVQSTIAGLPDSGDISFTLRVSDEGTLLPVPTGLPGTSSPTTDAVPTSFPSVTEPTPISTPTPETPTTVGPTFVPTILPSLSPTIPPITTPPTISPTTPSPTDAPTTDLPTFMPTTLSPTVTPTVSPTTMSPTGAPTTESPTFLPTTAVPLTEAPTTSPTGVPTTESPTVLPTTAVPLTEAPTMAATKAPTEAPITESPTIRPTTLSPTTAPVTASPTAAPTTLSPTDAPSTESPTGTPTTLSPSTATPSIITDAPASVGPTVTPGSPSVAPTTAAPGTPTTVGPTVTPGSPSASPTTVEPTMSLSPTISPAPTFTPPRNDNCPGSLPLEVGETIVTSTRGGTAEPTSGLDTCFRRDVEDRNLVGLWYDIVIRSSNSNTERMRISACNGTKANTAPVHLTLYQSDNNVCDVLVCAATINHVGCALEFDVPLTSRFGPLEARLRENKQNRQVTFTYKLLVQQNIPAIGADESPLVLTGSNVKVTWNDLTDNVRAAAQVLGYDKNSWNNGLAVPIDELEWAELNPLEQRAALVLVYFGHGQEAWDVPTRQSTTGAVQATLVPIGTYDDYAWSELSDDVRAAAEELGYDENSWENDLGLPIDELEWAELSPEEQEAAMLFGYDQEAWENSRRNYKREPQTLLRRQRRLQGNATMPSNDILAGGDSTTMPSIDPYPGGIFWLSLEPAVVPPNDDCLRAQYVEAGARITASAFSATPEPPQTTALCERDNGDIYKRLADKDPVPGVWYRMFVGGRVRLLASACGSERSDLVHVTVYTGACNALECLSEPETSIAACETSWDATSSESVYFILVERVLESGQDNGEFELAIALI